MPPPMSRFARRTREGLARFSRHRSYTPRAMRILVIGAGGVGSAVVPTAIRRDFFERLVIADYDAERAAAIARRASDKRVEAAFIDASNRELIAALIRDNRITHVLNAVDPRF